MRFTGFIVMIVGIGLLAGNIIYGIQAGYQWQNNYEAYWTLADRSSSLEAKSEQIDKFVVALEGAGIRGEHNALFFPTPSNSCDANLDALKTLQTRLAEIKTLDPNSFQYQSAIQQITAQEQGEANDMLLHLKECFLKTHFYFIWLGWGMLLWFLGAMMVAAVGAVMLFSDN